MAESELQAALRLHLRAANFPEWIEEHRFHPTRRWRFDFAWPPNRVACEVEGGVWTDGRHTRGSGFTEDCEKYNEAVLDDWKVIRVTAKHIDSGAAVGWLGQALNHDWRVW